MLRMNQKISWTRTELQKFAEYDNLECEAMLMLDEAMWFGGGITVGSRLYQTLEKMNDKISVLKNELKALMSTRRFDILMNDQFTLKAWRAKSLRDT